MYSINLDFTEVFDNSHLIIDANRNKLYNGGAIYIWGIEQNGKFCPLYVGQTDRLKTRIMHYYPSEIFGTRELYDLTLPMNIVYNSIEYYNANYLNQGTQQRLNLFLQSLPNEILFFNHREFFNKKLGNFSSEYFADSGQDFSLHYDLKKSIGGQLLIKQIIDARDILLEKFRFCYAPVNFNSEVSKMNVELNNNSVNRNDPTIPLRHCLESATKINLEDRFKIFTSAKSFYRNKFLKAGYSINNSVNPNFEIIINLNNIKNNLIYNYTPIVNGNDRLFLKY